MTFTTYVESWGTVKPNDLVQDMLNKGAIGKNCRIVLAFASFNFDSSTTIPGLENMTMADVQNFTNLVHSNGGKVSLSIGGATYPFLGSDLFDRPGDLANNINNVLIVAGFDGVDFDIEDSYSTAPSDFASNAASLINTLRSINSNLYITLTTPSQAWAYGMYQQKLINLTIGNINAWQPMEYDLYIQPPGNYVNQIMWDITYYISNWGVNPSKIIVGLMPGNDDMDHNLSLQDAISVSDLAKEQKLQGIMTWDANIDSNGIDNNSPYAYMIGIQSKLNTYHCEIM